MIKHSRIWATFLLAILLALLLPGPAKSAEGLKPGDPIGINAFCWQADDDATRPYGPGYDRLRLAIQELDEEAYVRVMRERGTRCIDVRLFPGLPPSGGVVVDLYDTITTDTGKCFKVWRYKVTGTEPPAHAFTWAVCSGEQI